MALRRIEIFLGSENVSSECHENPFSWDPQESGHLNKASISRWECNNYFPWLLTELKFLNIPLAHLWYRVLEALPSLPVRREMALIMRKLLTVPNSSIIELPAPWHSPSVQQQTPTCHTIKLHIFLSPTKMPSTYMRLVRLGRRLLASSALKCLQRIEVGLVNFEMKYEPHGADSNKLTAFISG